MGEIWNTLVFFIRDLLVFLHVMLVGLGLNSVPILGNLGWGLTIILFTLAIKLITLPLTLQQLRSSKAMQEIQPKLNELRKKYGKDKERLMQEQMELYREHKINPATGCLPLLIQMPVWIALYQALFALAAHDPTFGEPFLWLSSLAKPEGFPYILALLTGASQWVVQRMMTPRSADPQQKAMNNAMQFMPIMFIFFAFQVPSGLVLYWVTSNIFSMVQQYFTVGWGSLLPERAAAPAGATTREITKATEPSTNGKRPVAELQEPAKEEPRLGRAGGDGTDSSSRGPGGGKKKRIKRR